MKKLAVVIILILAAGGYLWFQHENKDDQPIKAPSANTKAQRTQTDSASGSGSPTGQAAGKTYKDGTYTGDTTDAFYGMMQVQLVVTGGKISDIQFLQYPNKPGHTTEVSNQALPLLKQEAIAKQSAPVDVISGATQTADAFNQSLASALAKAQ